MTANRFPSQLTHRDLGLYAGTKPLGKRTRRGITPSYPGVFASTKCLGEAVFDSLLERDFQTILCSDPRVEAYAVQAHQLIYWTPAQGGAYQQRIYTPDITLRRRDGRVMVFEVKAAALAKRAKWAALEPHIRNAYKRDHAVEYVVITERAIRVQPRLANYEKLLRYGARFDDPQAVMAVRDTFWKTEFPSRISEICAATPLSHRKEERAYTALLQLALKGEVTLDLYQPLSPSTPVISYVG